MRIIAGQLRGRQFKSPPGRRSHPMSEKMRGALFNALGDISGLRVLDAYSGSGAISFEAISRGAEFAQAIEKSVLAYRAIKKNIDTLDLEEQVKATRANVSTWSDNNDQLVFDVVIADPPYDDVRPNILEKLSRHLENGGIYVLSWPGSEEIENIRGLKIVKNSKYGDSQLVFYQKTG
jgi:16S rRNA (guanine966-N2)-methyltransferase